MLGLEILVTEIRLKSNFFSKNEKIIDCCCMHFLSAVKTYLEEEKKFK